jgi:hypothetical protein
MTTEEFLTTVSTVAYHLQALNKVDYDLRVQQFLRDMARNKIEVEWQNGVTATVVIRERKNKPLVIHGVCSLHDIVIHCFNEMSKYLKDNNGYTI